MRLISGVAAIALIACGTDEPETSSTESEVINPLTPFVGTSTILEPLFPQLAVRGRLPETTDYTNTSRLLARAARFSDGTDLAGPPSTIRLSYLDSLLTNPADASFVQAPAFAPRVNEMLLRADGHMGELSDGILTTAAKVFEHLPDFHPVYAHSTTFVGWSPPRARWLDRQWKRAPGKPLTEPETFYTYPTPAGLSGMPERGARLYCAAREVARNQGDGMLGRQVLLPISILGQHLDIGIFEPSAFVNQPERRKPDPDNDGAQAFNVPMTFGLRIQPISILPSLPEIRYPFVLTTGDSEIANRVGFEPIYEEKRCVHLFFGTVCAPIILATYRKHYKTVSHADIATSAGASLKAATKFPVFWAGPLLVNLGLHFGASVGQKLDLPTGPVAPPDDRLLYLPVPPAGWPATYRKTATSGNYLDGHWLGQTFPPDNPASEGFEIHSVDSDTDVDTAVTSINIESTDPFRSLVHADDDHHLTPASELQIGGELEGVIGFSASIAAIQISASGTVTGTLGLEHDVRDAVSATTSFLGDVLPVAGLIVTPTTYGDASLQFIVNFHLEIDLLFDSVTVEYNIVDSTVPLGHFRKPWDESHRLRIGTESRLGDPTFAPVLTSHVGAGAAFFSFPPLAGRQTVNQCLADDTDVPGPPLPCDSTPASTTPPQSSVCMYSEIPPNQPDLCANIPAITPESPVGLQCEAFKLTFLCAAASKQQYFGTPSQYVLAHKLDLPVPADPKDVHSPMPLDGTKLAVVAQICAKAAKGPDGTIPGGTKAWFESQFKFAACEADATLIDPSTVVKTDGAGDVGAARPCH